MSDQSDGPGWWQASDGRWYAPERHPNFVPPGPVAGPPGITPPLPPVATQTSSVLTQVQAPPASVQLPEDLLIGHSPLSSHHVPRRWWVWAAPVGVGGLALAIVLVLTVGGATKTTSTSPLHTSTGRTGLTGSYVGTGFQPFYMTLHQSGTSLTGTLTGVIVTSTSPQRLVDESFTVTGTAKGSKLTIVSGLDGQRYSTTGSIKGSSFSVDFGQGANVSFKPGTMAQFDALVTRDRESLLAQADLGASRATQSNLINALTEVRALYQVTQSYESTNGQPYEAHDFTAQAPEFTWIAGSCTAKTPNCISLQVVDVHSDHDAQGIALAAFSSESSTCWYAVDIEATPVVITGDASAFQSSNHSANRGVVAGSFYARSPVSSSPASCSASVVLHAHHAKWTDSFSSAGALS